jgi:RNA polymerase sigma-70 factor (ECF subfamily)
MSQSANSGRGLGGEAATMSSTSLLERVMARDGEAWSKLCRLYGPLVYRWAREAGLQDQDAADIGQEVFATVEARIATFRHDRSGDTFRGWLWTITRHKLGDHFRHRAARPAAAGGTDAYQRLQELPESSAEFESRSSASSGGAGAQAALLYRELEILRDEFESSTWQAFWRTVIDGQSSAQIAADLGLTPHAVRQAKYRVLQRLRSELGA